jgi:beta-galactosidase
MEPAEYRTRILAGRFKGGNPQQEYEPHIRNNGGDRVVTGSESFQRLLDLFITNTWRSWRTMGITGGMIPWHHDDHRALKRVNGPSLAWIAGPGGIPDQSAVTGAEFTAKDHSFTTGQTVTKQVVLINDHRAPQPYTATWDVRVGNKRVGGGTKKGTLRVAQTLFLPVQFAAPAMGAARSPRAPSPCAPPSARTSTRTCSPSASSGPSRRRRRPSPSSTPWARRPRC